MKRRQMQGGKESLRPIVEYLKYITPQQVEGFHSEFKKVRYLCNAVLGPRWTTEPLRSISKAQYTFDKLMLALNESIQLEREIEKNLKLALDILRSAGNTFEERT